MSYVGRLSFDMNAVLIALIFKVICLTKRLQMPFIARVLSKVLHYPDVSGEGKRRET